ncbi:YsnF/AvaK domain-containing protein [Alkalicoccus saliphilus]|nr:YsnF/AvaK domain-containing protein [Alkalicoccus saliphilus]
MSVSIVGVFEQEKHLKEEVQLLKNQGYPLSSVTVIAGKEDHPALYSENIAPGVQIEKLPTRPQDDNAVMAVLKSAFNTDEEDERKEDSEQTFKRMGLSNDDAVKFREAIDQGKMVLLLSKYKKRDREPGLKEDIRPITPLNERAPAPEEINEKSHTAQAASDKVTAPDREGEQQEDEMTYDRRTTLADMERIHEKQQPVQKTEETEVKKKSTEEPRQAKEKIIEKKEVTAEEREAPAVETEQVEAEKRVKAEERVEAEASRDTKEHRLDHEEEKALQLREEQLDVTKTETQKGEVGVQKRVVEEEKTIKVPVRREEVYVEKRPVQDKEAVSSENAAGETSDTAFKEESEEIRIPIREEEIEISKKPVVTEEVVVGKKVYEDTEEKVEKVKKEEAKIDEKGVVEGRTNIRGKEEE